MNLRKNRPKVDFEINKVLFCITVGLAAAIFIISKYQSTAVAIIKKLLRTGAIGEENSKTKAELGIKNNKVFSNAIDNKSSILKKIISSTNEKTMTYEQYLTHQKEEKEAKKKTLMAKFKIGKKDSTETANDIEVSASNKNEADNSKAEKIRYFINPEMKEYAENWICGKDSSIGKPILLCTILILFYIVLLFTMPSILSFLNGIVK